MLLRNIQAIYYPLIVKIVGELLACVDTVEFKCIPVPLLSHRSLLYIGTALFFA